MLCNNSALFGIVVFAFLVGSFSAVIKYLKAFTAFWLDECGVVFFVKICYIKKSVNNKKMEIGMTEEKKHLHEGHRERLKQRCREEGLDSFDDHQVLEMLLFYAIPYRDTNDLAHSLLQYFGSFSAVLDADYYDLLKIKGVGKNAATLLTSLPEFFRRYQLDRFGPKPMLTSTQDAGEYVCGLLMNTPAKEQFYMICLNNQRQVLKAALLAEGTLANVVIPQRTMLETALRYNAASVLFAHNHPSGSMRPSADDLALTDNFTAILNTVNIRVLDHLIASGDKYVSMAELGLIKGGL